MWINSFQIHSLPVCGMENVILCIADSSNHIVTDLTEMARLAAIREEENDHFRSFLELQNGDKTDALVFSLQETVSKEVDCRHCGNCCKSLMIVVTRDELHRVAELTHSSPTEWKEKNIEEGLSGKMILNAIPCLFLSEQQCTIYPDRFEGCREFPGLHLPGFIRRYFTLQMHYARCPIVFNVVEQLKKHLSFYSEVKD